MPWPQPAQVAWGACAWRRISRNIQYPVLTYVSNNLLNFRSRAQGYLMYCPAAIVRTNPLLAHVTPFLTEQSNGWD